MIGEKEREGEEMAKLLIGNVLGPQGMQGLQGPEGPRGNTGRRGSRWTDGILIDGISTEPTIYPTGLLDAQEEDYYLNSKNGNVYRCTKGGNDTEATWVYVGSVRGAMPDVEDVFSSNSKKNALSANAGRVLYEKIVAAGIFPKELFVSCEEPIYAISVTIENRDTSIIITDVDGNTGLYTYEKIGKEETAEVLVWINRAIGLESGVQIASIKSVSAGILKYKLYDGSNTVVCSYDSDVWNTLTEVVKGHQKELQVTEEHNGRSEIYNAYSYGMYKNGVREEGFPISHAKAIWWNKLENKTLYDKVEEGLFDARQFVCTEEELMNLSPELIGQLVPDAYMTGQFMKYVYNLPAIRTGTEEPDDTVGKDGDIYIMLESDE